MEETKFDKNTALEVWKKMVDVQMHFNEIGLKIRNFALTVYTFILAGIGFLINENISGNIIGMLIFLGGIVIFSFFLVDRNWYHLYLKAVGKKAGEFEEEWFKENPEMKMSTQIALDSNKGEKILFKKVEYNSTKRFNWFYYPLLISLLLGSLYFFFFYKETVKNVSNEDFNNVNKEYIYTKEENRILKIENSLIDLKNELNKNNIDSLISIVSEIEKENDSLKVELLKKEVSSKKSN